MESTLPTPYFMFDENLLQKDLDLLKASLSGSWNHYTIGYSFKTNSLPWLVTFFKKQGVLAEVVSYDEYSLAKYLGYADSEIIYNGPCKERKSFEQVLRAGGIVNLDSKQELEWLEELSAACPDDNFYAGIRVNFDLETLCPGETTMGEISGRFGFCYETGVFAAVMERMKKLSNLHICGLHLHSSSKTRSVKVFQSIARMACQLKREFDLSLTYIDLGGGYCGGMPEKPSYPDYFPVIGAELLQEFNPTDTALIVEPGISLISACTTFVTSIVDSRDIKGNRFLITDGSRFNVDATMIKSSYFYEKLYNSSYSLSRPFLPKQEITGYTCMECDRLFTIENEEELVVGDRIIYHNVGGYTLSLNPLFIQYFPAVYVQNGKTVTQVRKRWTPAEYVGGCIWE